MPEEKASSVRDNSHLYGSVCFLISSDPELLPRVLSLPSRAANSSVSSTSSLNIFATSSLSFNPGSPVDPDFPPPSRGFFKKALYYNVVKLTSGVMC